MSVHRPFTRGGRQLALVRPRPFVPPPVPVLLWHMVRRPAAGVALALRSQPRLARLAAWLFAAGLLQMLLASLFGRAEPANSYFLLRTIAVLYGAWFLAALLLAMAGRLLGAVPGLRPAFQVTGVAMCAGLLLMTAATGLVFCGWLAVVCYQTARQHYGLAGLRAAATALPAPAALAVLCLALHV